MPAQQEKNSIAFNRQAFSATSIICSDIFPCLLCKLKAKLLLLYSILPISNTVPYQLSLHFYDILVAKDGSYQIFEIPSRTSVFFCSVFTAMQTSIQTGFNRKCYFFSYHGAKLSRIHKEKLGFQKPRTVNPFYQCHSLTPLFLNFREKVNKQGNGELAPSPFL